MCFVSADTFTMYSDGLSLIPSPQITTENTFLIFHLRECKTVSIFLYASVLEPIRPEFEIQLGNISLVKLHGNIIISEQSTPDLLDCNSVKDFWLSWRQGNIRLGIGKLYENQVLSAVVDNSKVINAISFSASDIADSRELQFNKRSGTSILLAFKHFDGFFCFD